MVDLRIESPTFLNIIQAFCPLQIEIYYIYQKACHGFITLEDNSEIIYFNSQFYSPNHEELFYGKDKVVNITGR